MNFDEAAEIFGDTINDSEDKTNQKMYRLLNSPNQEIRRSGQIAQIMKQEKIDGDKIRELLFRETFDSFWQKIAGFCILKLLREERDTSLALDLCERFIGDGIPLQETVEAAIRKLSGEKKDESKRASVILVRNPKIVDRAKFERIATPKPTPAVEVTGKKAKK
jgi:hypothetical protein